MKVSELEGAELDYWVAKAEGLPLSCDWDQGEYILVGTGAGDLRQFSPSSDWDEGGPIIEREKITLYAPGAYIDEYEDSHDDVWKAVAKPARYPLEREKEEYGATALIAACRAFVASKFGEEVEPIAAARPAG